jgi:hypothetical protein
MENLNKFLSRLRCGDGLSARFNQPSGRLSLTLFSSTLLFLTSHAADNTDFAREIAPSDLDTTYHVHQYQPIEQHRTSLQIPSDMSRPSRGRKQAKKGVQLTLMVVGESLRS